MLVLPQTSFVMLYHLIMVYDNIMLWFQDLKLCGPYALCVKPHFSIIIGWQFHTDLGNRPFLWSMYFKLHNLIYISIIELCCSLKVFGPIFQDKNVMPCFKLNHYRDQFQVLAKSITPFGCAKQILSSAEAYSISLIMITIICHIFTEDLQSGTYFSCQNSHWLSFHIKC